MAFSQYLNFTCNWVLSHLCPDGFTYALSSLHCGNDALSRDDGSGWARWANLAHSSLGNQRAQKTVLKVIFCPLSRDTDWFLVFGPTLTKKRKCVTFATYNLFLGFHQNWPAVWQYRLWSFQTGGTKLERFENSTTRIAITCSIDLLCSLCQPKKCFRRPFYYLHYCLLIAMVILRIMIRITYSIRTMIWLSLYYQST